MKPRHLAALLCLAPLMSTAEQVGEVGVDVDAGVCSWMP